MPVHCPLSIHVSVSPIRILISEIDDLGSPYCHDVDLEFNQPSQPNVHSQIKEFVMSVLLETSLGDIVIDLLVDAAPRLCEK
jgi:hypothetical protein